MTDFGRISAYNLSNARGVVQVGEARVDALPVRA
jgi:hypothetical protein